MSSFPKWLNKYTPLPALYERCYSPSSLAFSIVNLSHFSCSGGCVYGMFMLCCLIVALTCFSLMFNKGERFLIYVFSIDVCFPPVACSTAVLINQASMYVWMAFWSLSAGPKVFLSIFVPRV